MDQLKEECRAKELVLAQQQFAGQRSERERASLTAAAARLQREVVELEGRRLSQRLETNKLAAAAANAAQVWRRIKPQSPTHFLIIHRGPGCCSIAAPTGCSCGRARQAGRPAAQAQSGGSPTV